MKQFICLFFIAMSASLFGQVQFTSVVSKNRLALNERLSIEFKMNVDGDNFTPPNFEGFQVVAGPSQSVSQRWINGQSSMSKSYRYVLQPSRTGRLTIQHGVMTYDGRPYKTDFITIDVTGAVSQPKDINDTSPEAVDNVHLVADISKGNPYLNEPIRVVYKLYVKDNTGVSKTRVLENPKYADFWSLNIDNTNRQIQNGTFQGEPYRYLVLSEAILYPQKTGKLEIEPLTMDVDVQIPTNRKDFFGRPYTKTVTIKVSAGKREIDVKNFPVQRRPASFTGAVGQFDFAVKTDRAQLQAGESLLASVEVSGSGNLKLMELPKIKTPKNLEVYEPERIDKVNTSINGMKGSIIDQYTIVPQYGGKYIIPPVEFSYFDPAQEKYITINSGESLIMVDGQPSTEAGSDAAAAEGNKNVITAADRFAFIKTDTQFTAQEKTYFFNTTTYWSILGGILLLLPVVMLVRGQQERRSLDVTGNRIRKTSRLSRKYLSAAKKNLGNHEQFYISLEKCLHNYLRSKLNIQTFEMSKDRVNVLLAERGASEATRKEFIELLASCEFARYTPSSEATMTGDFEKAGRVLNDIDKQLKR